ncbi:helix-turn-helix domain-containing protein [Paraburkholderia sp. DHOC27]|uniref:AraC-like ligand-binding domain-containing protein n=1 Tax=Paraburkholderia sp. DHOC27 TaxID=2303330 RepID=UPI0015F344C2|nr:helix-turn-helix domain-containing protein [Paraburkholderia sp. DHOC27]
MTANAPVIISTDPVPIGGRLDFWQSQVGSLLTHLECSSCASDTFSGRITAHLSQPANLIKIGAATHEIARAKPKLSQAGEEQVFICLQTEGEAIVEQDGRRGVLKPGDLTLLDTSRTFSADFPASMSQLVLQVPKALVRKQIGSVERFTATVVTNHSPIGSVTNEFIKTLARSYDRLPPAMAQRLTEHATEMAMMAVASCVENEGAVRSNASNGKSLLASRARAYIETNLRNASLSPADVAQHLGISRRYLSTIFASEGQSAERYIWDRRLARCARDLRDPGQSSRSIGDIAFGWGFNSLPHFSQSFKTAFGKPPRHYRKES